MSDIAIGIRTATIDDAAAIRDVHEASVRALTSGHYSPAVIEERARAMSDERYLPSIGDGRMLVAIDRGTVVGFGTIDLRGSEISAVYVAPDVVRRGVGAALLARLETMAVEAGIVTIGLKSSLNAVDFYIRHGYTNLGTTTHPIPGGSEIECVRMSKRLGAARR